MVQHIFGNQSEMLDHDEETLKEQEEVEMDTETK